MQEFFNRQYFHLTLFTLVFGVMFYDLIHTIGFDYVDELCALLLLVLFAAKVFRSETWACDRSFLVMTGVFLFYLVYSLVLGVNVKAAVLTDFVIQMKPYLAFCCAFALCPKWNDNQRKIVRQVVLLCSVYVLAVGIGWLMYYEVIEYTFGHPSRLATASTVLAFLYLYCSDYTKRDKLVFILILSFGILSGRSKHYGFFAICSFMTLFLTGSFRLKMDFKTVAVIVVGLALMVFVARHKIYVYFIYGGFGEGRAVDNLYARAALYYFSLNVFTDYFPFGPGFGTYATYASAEYYSPVYVKYGMEHMHGLSKSYPEFIADTYYPALAQFGVAGVVVFFSFWIRMAVKAVKGYNACCVKEACMSLMIVVFVLIECTSDSTITHNRGMFIMMLLAMLASDMRHKVSKYVPPNEYVKE